MSIESMVKALHTPDLSPSEKLLLLGIANHDGDGGAWPSEATLAMYVGVKERQLRNLLRQLEDRGLVTTQTNGGGTARTPNDRRPNRYELHFDGGQPSASRGVSPIAAETSTGTVSTSSLRSDGDVREESGSDGLARGVPPAAPNDDAGRRVARGYWDAFVAANDGLRPSSKFLILASVARKVLRAGVTESEAVEAMLATRVMTGEAVVKEAVRIRREQENRPATGAIDPRAMQLVMDWTSLLARNDSRFAAEAWLKASHAEKVETMQALSTMLNWPSMTGVEVAARFGGFVRAHGKQWPTLDDLKAVPLGSRPLRPDDTMMSDVFRKYATGPRLEG